MAAFMFTVLWITGFLLNRAFFVHTANPTFSGATYPVVVSHDEGTATAAGTTFHTFTCTDADGVNPVLSYTYDPTDGSDMFTITESNPSAGTTQAVVTLATGKEFNYETQETYKIYVNAYDGVNYADDEVLLTISVGDVGEAPTLSPATTVQTFEIDESPLGTAIGSPAFTVNDLDLLEVHTWSMIGGTGQSYLTLINTNGTLFLNVDYDREDATKPANFYVDVAVTDKYSLSVTTTYSVIVADINDNAPVFPTTTFTYNCDLTTPLSTVVATLAATDADVTSPNNDITYSLQTTTIAEYFNITGSTVVLQYTFDVVYGSGPYSFLIYATDGGSPAMTATATMSITTSPTTTQPTTTTLVPPAGYNFNENDNNAYLIIACCAIGALLIGYLVVICWRFHTYKQCLPDRCLRPRDCDKCCDCCDSDFEDDDEAVTVKYDKQKPEVMVVPSSKGGPLGPEAVNSMKKPPKTRF